MHSLASGPADANARVQLAAAVSRAKAAADEAQDEEEEGASWTVCAALVSGVSALCRRAVRRQLSNALGERGPRVLR